MNRNYTQAARQDAGGRLLPSLIFALGDYAALVVTGMLSVFLRNCIMTYSVFHVSLLYLFLWLPMVFMFFIFYSGLYGRRMLIYRMVERLFFACLEGAVLSIILMFFAQVSGQVSRFFVLAYLVIAFVLLAIVRVILSKAMKKVKAFQIPVLIVGAGQTAELVVRQILHDSGMRYRVVGFLEDRHPVDIMLHGFPVLGGFGDMEEVIQETGVHTVLIAAPGLPQDDLSSLIYRAQSLVKQVDVIPNLVAVPMSNVTAESFFDAKIMVLHIRNNLASPWNQMLKRLFDIVATICGGLLVSPILLAIAFWVYHDSPGPVIFKHRRVGRNGKEFNCYKFRSMCVNSKEVLEHLLATDPEAKAEWDKEFKLKNDPRITKSGAFLRKTSLDELPQLWNVLKGEMSLVGPRPIVQAEVPRYGKYIKEYYSVLPGITGMWQTSGRSDIDYPERVQMDSWYVHNWSVWLDMVLLWRTVAVVLQHKGAY
ncbi:undecaprenyl-phosphate galactose phosphotransferase WbaP [Dialister hominis]|uniref:undecaprenyl-phosphate galactose phosphotransferase WbaP n=1 Tax=Dialister hominis TaxID=2582419 RepID=UPI003AB55C78